MKKNNIRQILEFEGLKIIRRYPSDEDLASYPTPLLNQNVEAYDQKGNFIWVIQECPVGNSIKDKPYMNIWIKGKNLIAGNWVGLDFIVNMQNGNVEPSKLGTRPW